MRGRGQQSHRELHSKWEGLAGEGRREKGDEGSQVLRAQGGPSWPGEPRGTKGSRGEGPEHCPAPHPMPSPTLAPQTAWAPKAGR